MDEGFFNMSYPKESFILLLSSTLYLSYHFTWDHETHERMCAALEEITARVLGVKDYRFHLEI